MTTEQPNGPGRGLHPLIVGTAIGVAHFALSWLGFVLTPWSVTRNLLWPGPGFAFAILVVFGMRYWPAIAFSALLYARWVSGSNVSAIVLTATLMVTVVMPAALWQLRRGYTSPLFGVRRVLEFLFVANVMMPVLGALQLALGMLLTRELFTYSYAETLAIAAGTISAGTMFCAPVVLTWAGSPRPSLRPARVFEAALLGTSTLLLCLIVQGEWVGPRALLGLNYLPFPFLMWAAIRFGQRGVASIASLVILCTMVGAASGHGIFVHQNTGVSVLYLDGFCLTFAGTGLLIGAAIEESGQNLAALGKSEYAYRELIEQASDAIFVGNADGELVEANARASELLGYTRAEFRGMHLVDLIPPGERLSNPPRDFPIGRPQLYERRMRTKDGTIREVEVSAMRLDDRRVQAIVRDISGRKLADAQLRHALSLIEATLESTTDGILVVDLEGRIRGYNGKFVQLWGIPDEVLAKREDDRAVAYVLDQLRNPEEFIARVRHLYAHREETSFDTLEFKDGRVYERYSQPQTIAGVVQGRVWSFRDVTERLRLETQLRHALKMEAVGSLAGGVAHDFNNLLTAIMGHSSLLLARMREKDPMREEVSEIHRASERAAMLTRQLLTFSRQQVFEASVIDLNVVVRSMERMLNRTLGENIRIVLRPAVAPLWIRADAGQIELALLNLSINARDAMPRGGTLTIETAPVRLERGANGLEIESGDYVQLSLADTGVGMDEATRLRIFDPFFTTKERGRGTGLGLAAVYGIVKQGGGVVTVESRREEGTRFDLYFPRSAAASAAPADPERRDEPWRGQGRVLLVEDEDMVRGLLREALATAGFDVLAAKSGDEALERAGAGPPLDLLVTDVVMPSMSGPELAQRLLQRQPDLRVLFISGYTSDELVNRVAFGSAFGFLQKPFSPAALIRKIQEVLRPARA